MYECALLFVRMVWHPHIKAFRSTCHDAVLDPQRKRPGRPPKKRDNPAEGYQSAVACHLAENADCCRSYRESDFTVLSRCRSKQHRDVLEAMYIRCCKASGH